MKTLLTLALLFSSVSLVGCDSEPTKEELQEQQKKNADEFVDNMFGDYKE